MRRYLQAGGWHWVFPQDHLSVDPRSEILRRHHAYDETRSRALKQAARAVDRSDRRLDNLIN